MALLYLIGIVACLYVFSYSLMRKMQLNQRYWDSLGKGLRDWDEAAVQDAQGAVSDEMGWTLILIMAMLGSAPFIAGFISALSG